MNIYLDIAIALLLFSPLPILASFIWELLRHRSDTKRSFPIASKITAAADHLKYPSSNFSAPLLQFGKEIDRLRKSLPDHKSEAVGAFIDQIWDTKQAFTSEAARSQDSYEIDGFSDFAELYDSTSEYLNRGRLVQAFEELGQIYMLALTQKLSSGEFNRPAEIQSAQMLFAYSEAIINYKGILLSEELELKFKSRSNRMKKFWSQLSPMTLVAWAWVRRIVFPMGVGWRIKRSRNPFYNWLFATEEEIAALYISRAAIAVSEGNKRLLVDTIIKGFRYQNEKKFYLQIITQRWINRLRFQIAGGQTNK